MSGSASQGGCFALRAFLVLLTLPLFGCGGCATAPVYQNAYDTPEDDGRRPAFTYFFRRAWVQLTRDMDKTPLPPVDPINFAALAEESFAVAWIGHATQLVRVDGRWILIDPALEKYVGPLNFFGPKRLTPLPFDLDDLPHIDAVLISHDHFDHLDLRSLRILAAQPGGPPTFYVPEALGPWFARNLNLPATEFTWWQTLQDGGLTLTFLPAQHNSGRSLRKRNTTLWGGWLLEHNGLRFYYAGDTAYSAELFRDIRARVGLIHLAALPIGAYEPRELMRFDHTNPADSVQAHIDLGALRSFGVHWATFQLGDEEPIQPALDLATALKDFPEVDFVVLPIGGFLPVRPPAD
ncbi:MAG: MBL fold metallo-hydrolase [Opitutales bacterium]|nr:MBL fold metallo-hydrolase [Opitutales bacterium]